MTSIQVNSRGIPQAPFVENVETFVQPGEQESTLAKFQEMVAKYKFMETHLLQRKNSLESKIPEITKTLEMVEFLSKVSMIIIILAKRSNDHSI